MSTCDSRTSRGPSASPRRRATRFGRSSVRPSSSTSKPASRRMPARCSWHSRSAPGGLTVRKRTGAGGARRSSCWRSGTTLAGYASGAGGRLSPPGAILSGAMDQLFDTGEPPRGRTAVPPEQGRSRRACARARSTRSSARSTCSAPGQRPAHRDRAGAPALDGPLRAPGLGQDDDRADRRDGRARRVRGAQRRRGRAPRGAQGARARRPPAQGTGEPTIFFLDEIHRFNKAQQDALLPGRRGGPRHAHRGDDREPVLRGQLGPAVSRAGLRAARALGGRRRGAAAPRARPRRVRPARGARRRGRVPRGARRRRRADRPGGPRAGVRDRARRRADHARARRGRAAAPRAHLRQAGRPPLRHDLGLDQGDARLGPGRVAVLPRGDDRVRRGPALHRPADGHPRLGGRGQRRPAGAAGRGRRGERRRARRACPRRPTRSPSARSTSRSRRSRTRPASRSARRASSCRSEAPAAAALPAERGLPGRGAARARAGLRLPARQPAQVSDQELLPDAVVGHRFYAPGETEATLRERLERIRRARGRRSRSAPSTTANFF